MNISIFCKAIDNYGDVGVCLRLAQNLVNYNQQFNITVNLYIDCMQTLAAILQNSKPQNVNLLHWANDDIRYDNAQAVINAFACKLPSFYQQYMPCNIVWIQLDYLATESWANEYNYMHAFIGKHKRIFITPGFSVHTAGLLTNDYDDKYIQDTKNSKDSKDNIKLLAFIYLNDSSINGLLHFLQHKNVIVYMHESLLHQLKQNYPQYMQQWNSIMLAPFVPQQELDNLFKQFDILWVRGEDSFIRAQLCAIPMLWQAYPQSENAHYDKLDGFLAQYYMHNANYTSLNNILNCINGRQEWQSNTVHDFIYMLSYNKQYRQHLKNWQQYLLQTVPKLDYSIINIIRNNQK
jgi:uncharacterized repeat protein (TIGR03837 family)